MHKQWSNQTGFTIVELLIVIVVIGILAAISIVAYSGIQQRAVAASLTSDLDNAVKLLRLDQVSGGTYPTALALANNNKGIPASSDTTYLYTVSNTTNPQTFCITATKGTQNYNVTQEGVPSSGVCPTLNLDASISSSYPGTGTTWTDLSGNGNNGALANGVAYSGANGGTFSFDGIDDYISVPDNNSLHFGTGDFSVSFWCYRTASGYQGGSYILKGPYGTPGFDTFDGTFRVDTVNGNLARVGLNTTYNVWENHIFAVNQSISPYIRHYINGVLNQTGYVESGFTGSVDSATSLVIGRSNAGGVNRYFNGSIGGVRTYNRALSVDEVSRNFNSLRSRYGI
ncbi:prepilin-type N-terminal cleavage/methylation domain-containing protein [Candidatus Saccharibacteria bacterium]|nr:prepilin-type N-terminal cleavage/methylation domain-containing protein [Candidatus Saccharibacteria bacterium]